jgi:hypothetical protein
MASDRQVYHVVTTEKGWSVQKEGDKGSWEFFGTKEEAVRRGRELGSSHERGQVIIHKTDGTIEEERTFGDDPASTPG